MEKPKRVRADEGDRPLRKRRAAGVALLLGALAALVFSAYELRVPTRTGPSEPPDDTPGILRPASNDLSFTAVVLFDDRGDGPASTEGVKRRCQKLATLFARESEGRLTLTPRIVSLSAKALGPERLVYSSHRAGDWAAKIRDALDHRPDVLMFVPASGAYAPWCTDSPTLGYNRGGMVFFCLERHLDAQAEDEDPRAVALMAHKLLHGFGYHHLGRENKAMALLRWPTGLPRETLTPLLTPGPPATHFGPRLRKVLGLDPFEPFEDDCLDGQGLSCLPEDDDMCAAAYDMGCLDADRDGIRDSKDDYVFSPPGRGSDPDADGDGIPDELDLCPNVRIDVRGRGDIRKARAIAARPVIDLSFEVEGGRLLGVDVVDGASVQGILRFDDKEAESFPSSEVKRDIETWVTRLRIRYMKDDIVFYRPYYVYFRHQRLATVRDKEWLYFLRFGCDVPEEIDFSKHATFDADLDGLPDPRLFSFAAAVDQSYDWDQDGTPDIEDTLPSVFGKCATDLIRGVPDSDGDGFCDPASIVLLPAFEDAPLDLHVEPRRDPGVDLCPYRPSDAPGGCPVGRSSP